MNIKQWLPWLLEDSGEHATDTVSPTAASRPRGAELDLSNAIEAHQEWKHRLEAAIRSRSVLSLDARQVARDDQCELGRWIHGPAATEFSRERQFVDLRNKHAAFHRCAARSVSLSQAGQHELALEEIAETSEFATLSWEVIGDLASMFSRLEGARA
jgi:hypothetical protein